VQAAIKKNIGGKKEGKNPKQPVDLSQKCLKQKKIFYKWEKSSRPRDFDYKGNIPSIHQQNLRGNYLGPARGWEEITTTREGGPGREGKRSFSQGGERRDVASF